MVKKRQMHVLFPLAGLNRSGAYRQQAPYSTADCMNVRSAATLEGRERGGSRPGVVYSHIDDIGGEVRMLAPMTLALSDGFTAWSDTFAGTSLAAAWSQASWASGVPLILPSALASVDTDTAEGEVVLTALTIDTAQAYTIEMDLSPWNGAWHGAYRIYLRMDNATPLYTTEGVFIELVSTGTDGAFTATLNSYLATAETVVDTADDTIGSVFPGWLTATVSGDTVTVYWCGTQIMSGVVDAHAGSRVGFGMECTVDGGICLANVFRAQYYSTGNVPVLRSALIASADGDLFVEGPYGRMTVVVSDLTIRNDVSIMAAQSGQDLFIADYGDVRDSGTDGTVTGFELDDAAGQNWTTLGIDTDSDVCVISNAIAPCTAGTYKIDSVAAGALTLLAAPGNGACSYRIERAPKVYDPSAETFVIYAATAGQVPTGCPLISRYLGRIVMSGAEIAPHAWFMSRQNDEYDFDYSQDDSQRAVAGTASEAGVPGDPIVAQIPHSDDYLIFGCMNSVWRMAGDPAYGGSLDALSRSVGIIGPNAWCLGPAGELIFLSLNGLYALPPGGNSYPIPLSEDILPDEFRNIDASVLEISLEYDVQDNGVHVYLTPESSNARTHWWFDWGNKTFWPLTLASDYEPTATCAIQATAIEESGVILGGRDGKLRRFSRLAGNDCGASFTSYVVMGPIALAKDSFVGSVLAMDAVMAEGSGSVTWSLHSSLTFEGSSSASSSDTGTWSDGLNATNRPACRGQACTVKVAGTSGARWAFEQVTMLVKEAGQRRIP